MTVNNYNRRATDREYARGLRGLLLSRGVLVGDDEIRDFLRKAERDAAREPAPEEPPPPVRRKTTSAPQVDEDAVS